MLPPSYNNSAAQASLAPVASSPEYYIPLWWHSGGTASVGNVNTQSGASASYTLARGSTSFSANNKLHTLNAAWTSSAKYAFEAAFYNGVGIATNVALWDYTTSGIVSGSQISVTATAITVVRSGQFTLTPGRQYGVVSWGGGASGLTYITDASLIVFPS